MGRGGDSELPRDTKRSAAVGKDFPLGGNHFPLLSRQVSEWWSDLPQAHSWERSDGCVSVGALPTASTWGSISFRALIHSPPASFILAAGRQTQRVNWGRGDPRRGAPLLGRGGSAGLSLAEGRRTGVRTADPGPYPSPAPRGPACSPAPLHLRPSPPPSRLISPPAGSVPGPHPGVRTHALRRGCHGGGGTRAGSARSGCCGRGGAGPCWVGGASSPWSRSAAGVSRPPSVRQGLPP